MVEWKLDPEDGIPKLMEINPRFWGSLELAVRAGVNFPVLYADAVLGRTPTGGDYRDGIVCRWMFPGELLRYMTQDRNDRESLFSFFKGIPQTSEEWDHTDIQGFIAAFLCPGFLMLYPKYWKYLRR
jgi:predicted ATP-grasp superfamily ATP-dependent carboligase